MQQAARASVFAVVLAFLVPIGACSSSDEATSTAERGTLVDPPLGDGKADIADRVDLRGELGFGEAGAAAATFSEDLEFHGYTLTTRPGAVLTLDVTQKGTSRNLDTTLFVYGPKQAGGGYGTKAIAFDDDAGWGLHSRLSSLSLADGGTYLVVPGTHDGRGRGNYRLLATCESGDCGPVVPAGACHPDIAAAIEACVQDWMAAPDFDPTATRAIDLIEQCADAEVVAPAHDQLCARPDAPPDVCALDSEAFATAYLPVCRKELTNDLLDHSCVFGDRYRDLFGRAAEAIVLVKGTVLTAASPLTDLERAQIVAAVVGSTAYTDVTTADEAFAAVDSNEVNQHELWDASNRSAYTVYEVGAGDNSFGMVFAQGTTTPALTINDGDYVGCQTMWGQERRRCAADADCTEGLRCTGMPADGSLGRCIDTSKDNGLAMGSECTEASGCPAGSGLVCGGAALGGSGICQPGWMRGLYVSEPALAIPDNNASGTEAQLLVYGLASVDMDVRLDLLVSHPRISDLRVRLVNPAGTEVMVFDGSSNGPELAVYGKAIAGFPGDETVNGAWRLKVVDTVSGQTGVVSTFGLTITSRWD